MEPLKPAEPPTTPGQGGRSIVIVDDEVHICTLLQKMAAREGHHATVFDKPEEALEFLKSEPVHLLITDMRMPTISGLELIKKIREFNEKLEIIVITGHGTMDTFIEAIHAGANDFILKPIRRDQFLHAINRSLDRVKLIERIAERTNQLAQSEKMASLGLLATGVAHEINNPTTFIRSNLQLMREYLKRLDSRLEDINNPDNQKSLKKIILEEFPAMVEEAIRGTERIEKIVSGIKHYAHKSDSDEGEPVDIREVIAQSVNLVRAKLRRNIKITEDYLNVHEIHGNFSKLEQVFVNLLVNAADAINCKIEERRNAGDTEYLGEIEVSATIFEGEDDQSNQNHENLILTFSDNGGGIPKKKISRIFDPFFTTKAVGSGTGLGLYICYEIIKQHGGDITAQSFEGEGTSFIIKLPVDGANTSV